MDEGSSEVKESVQSSPEDGISGTTNSAMEAPSPMVIDPSPQNQYVLLKPENLIGSQINQSTLQQASVSLPQGFKGQNITILQPHFLPKVRLSGSRPLIAVNRPGLIPVQVSQARPIIINSITQNSIQKHHILPKGSSPEKHGVPTTVTKQVYMPVSFAPGSSATSTLTVRSIAPRVAVAGNVLQGNEVEQQPRAQPVAPRAIAPQPRQLILPAQVGGAPIRLNSSSLQSLGNNVVRLQGPSGEMVQAVITQVHQVRSSNSQDALSVNIQSKANRGDDEPMNGDDLSVDTKPVKKPCNCTKSQCLKLYCDCFANGEFCKNCNCMNCSNNRDHEAERSKAIKACLERNPYAFHPKIGKSRGIAERRHTKGCHCKRSGCLKNYCECYEAKIMCSTLCRCTGCKNFEESPERKTLMHLADAAEVRVLQQNAARSKLESQLEAATSKSGSSNTEKTLPFAFITSPVVNATCECLMARAEEAELNNMSEQRAERLLLDEFGRSLRQIIQTANKAKDYSV